MGKLRRKIGQGINWWKTSQPDEEKTEEENQKIISVNIVKEKTFQPELRIEKEKPRLMEKRGVCLRRDLFKERLGW